MSNDNIDQLLSKKQLEKDGLVDTLYQYLWTKNDREEGCRVVIPDTIVYRNRIVEGWYFTARSGRDAGTVKRKAKQSITPQIIEELFLAKVHEEFDIVATYMENPEGSDGKPLPNGKTSVEYLTRDQLHDLIHKRRKGMSAVLQRFVPPKGGYNSVIRAVWSPQLCLLEKRTNRSPLYDTRIDILRRAVTYDGPEHFSEISTVRGSVLPRMIIQLCETITNHITIVTKLRARVARLVLNLKVGADGRLYLINAASLRMEDADIVARVAALQAASQPAILHPLDSVLYQSNGNNIVSVLEAAVGSSDALLELQSNQMDDSFVPDDDDENNAHLPYGSKHHLPSTTHDELGGGGQESHSSTDEEGLNITTSYTKHHHHASQDIKISPSSSRLPHNQSSLLFSDGMPSLLTSSLNAGAIASGTVQPISKMGVLNLDVDPHAIPVPVRQISNRRMSIIPPGMDDGKGHHHNHSLVSPTKPGKSKKKGSSPTKQSAVPLPSSSRIFGPLDRFKVRSPDPLGANGVFFDPDVQCPSCSTALPRINTDALIGKSAPSNVLMVQCKVIITHYTNLCSLLSIKPFLPSPESAAYDGAILDTAALAAMAPKPHNYWPPLSVVTAIAGGVGVYGSYPPSDGPQAIAEAVAASNNGTLPMEPSILETGTLGNKSSSKILNTHSIHGLSATQPPSVVSEVPPTIQNMAPLLTAQEYRSLRSDPLFLNHSVRVCESCYIGYTAVQSSMMAGTEIRNSLMNVMGLAGMRAYHNYTRGGTKTSPVHKLSESSLSSTTKVGPPRSTLRVRIANDIEAGSSNDTKHTSVSPATKAIAVLRFDNDDSKETDPVDGGEYPPTQSIDGEHSVTDIEAMPSIDFGYNSESVGETTDSSHPPQLSKQRKSILKQKTSSSVSKPTTVRKSTKFDASDSSHPSHHRTQEKKVPFIPGGKHSKPLSSSPPQKLGTVAIDTKRTLSPPIVVSPLSHANAPLTASSPPVEGRNSLTSSPVPGSVQKSNSGVNSVPSSPSRSPVIQYQLNTNGNLVLAPTNSSPVTAPPQSELVTMIHEAFARQLTAASASAIEAVSSRSTSPLRLPHLDTLTGGGTNNNNNSSSPVSNAFHSPISPSPSPLLETAPPSGNLADVREWLVNRINIRLADSMKGISAANSPNAITLPNFSTGNNSSSPRYEAPRTTGDVTFTTSTGGGVNFFTGNRGVATALATVSSNVPHSPLVPTSSLLSGSSMDSAPHRYVSMNSGRAPTDASQSTESSNSGTRGTYSQFKSPSAPSGINYGTNSLVTQSLGGIYDTSVTSQSFGHQSLAHRMANPPKPSPYASMNALSLGPDPYAKRRKRLSQGAMERVNARNTQVKLSQQYNEGYDDRLRAEYRLGNNNYSSTGSHVTIGGSSAYWGSPGNPPPTDSMVTSPDKVPGILSRTVLAPPSPSVPEPLYPDHQIIIPTYETEISTEPVPPTVKTEDGVETVTEHAVIVPDTAQEIVEESPSADENSALPVPPIDVTITTEPPASAVSVNIRLPTTPNRVGTSPGGSRPVSQSFRGSRQTPRSTSNNASRLVEQIENSPLLPGGSGIDSFRRPSTRLQPRTPLSKPEDTSGDYHFEGLPEDQLAYPAGIIAAGRVIYNDSRMYTGVIRRAHPDEVKGIVWRNNTEENPAVDEATEGNDDLSSLENKFDSDVFAIYLRSHRSNRTIVQYMRAHDMRHSTNPLVQRAITTLHRMADTVPDSILVEDTLFPTTETESKDEKNIQYTKALSVLRNTVLPVNIPYSNIFIHGLFASNDTHRITFLADRMPPVHEPKVPNVSDGFYISQLRSIGSSRYPCLAIAAETTEPSLVRQPLFSGTVYEIETGRSDSFTDFTFPRLVMRTLRQYDLHFLVVYAAKCRIAACAGQAGTLRNRTTWALPIRYTSLPMAGTVARLIPGHWLGGRSTLDRSRGFVANPYAAAAQTESAKVAQAQSRGKSSHSHSRTNRSNNASASTHHRKQRDRSAASDNKTNSLSGASRGGSSRSGHSNNTTDDFNLDSDSDGITTEKSSSFNVRRVGRGKGQHMDVVDVHETFELLDLAAVSTAEINFQQSAEHCPLGTLARSIQMLPDGTSIYTTLSLDASLVSETKDDQSTSAADRPPFHLRMIAGKDATSMRTTAHWVHMEELPYPIMDPATFVQQDIHDSTKLSGNPLIDPAGFLCSLDIPVQSGETLIATRLVPGDYVQRFIGDVDAGSIHAALRSPLGLHPSIQIRGVYVISLWARSPKPHGKHRDNGYQSNSRPVTADKGVTLARGGSSSSNSSSGNRKSSSSSRSPSRGRSGGGNSSSSNASRVPTFRIRCQYLRHPYGPFLRTEIHDAHIRADESAEQAFLAPSSAEAFVVPTSTNETKEDNEYSSIEDQVITGNMVRELDQKVLASVQQQQQDGTDTNEAGNQSNNNNTSTAAATETIETLGRKNAAMLMLEMDYWCRTGNMPSSKRIARIAASAKRRITNPPYPKVRLQQNEIEPVYEYDLGLEELTRADLNPFIERKDGNLYGLPIDITVNNDNVNPPSLFHASPSTLNHSNHNSSFRSATNGSRKNGGTPPSRRTSRTSKSSSKSPSRTVSANSRSPSKGNSKRTVSASNLQPQAAVSTEINNETV